jgi:hypothetical protein
MERSARIAWHYFDEEIDGDVEGQLLIKPPKKHPVWVCIRLTTECKEVLCDNCAQTIAKLKTTEYNITRNKLTHRQIYNAQTFGTRPILKKAMYGVHFLSYTSMPHIARLTHVAQMQHGLHTPNCQNSVCF